jgi:hypothetical protein
VRGGRWSWLTVTPSAGSVDRLIEAVRAGESRALVVSGEAGAGNTVRHRLRRTEKHTGRSLSRPRDVAELCLAFEVHRRLM